MDLIRYTTRQLHQEHETTFDLCARLENAVSGPNWPPSGDNGSAISVMRTIESTIALEVMRHFEFEEKSLFPLLSEAGEADIAGLLIEEHEVIRECASDLSGLLERARTGTLDKAGWTSLANAARELAERLVAHAQKEEMALLPALDDTLDEETDQRLLDGYLSG
ncbi:MAG: hemerythrin domain-containing protein [Burkholderiaceae bacterium]|nr:hemerythrin domain-containing protein [Burkholderiaceae bacterium]